MTLKEKLLGKELNRQICFLTSFAMLLVVIGHSDMTDDCMEWFLYKWIYGFHMPLFFFVSGFLFAHTTPREKLVNLDLKKFYAKKVKRLLIPYFFFSAFFFVIKATLISTELMKHPVEFTWNSFVHYFFIDPIGYLWFLPTLFVLFLVFVPFIQRFARIDSYRFTLLCVGAGGGILSMIMPHFFEIDRAFKYSPYFITGFLYCLDKEAIDVCLKNYMDVLLSVSLVMSVILVNNWSYISGFTGILLAVTMSLAMLPYVSDYTVVFSRFTYTIFLLSYIPQMFIRGPIAHLVPMNQYVLSCLSFASGLILPIAMGMFVFMRNDSKYWKNVKLIIGL